MWLGGTTTCALTHPDSMAETALPRVPDNSQTSSREDHRCGKRAAAAVSYAGVCGDRQAEDHKGIRCTTFGGSYSILLV
jgi:hypothetical protein